MKPWYISARSYSISRMPVRYGWWGYALLYICLMCLLTPHFFPIPASSAGLAASDQPDVRLDFVLENESSANEVPLESSEKADELVKKDEFFAQAYMLSLFGRCSPVKAFSYDVRLAPTPNLEALNPPPESYSIG